MEIITVTPPTEEPITYLEAKDYLRADLDYEQPLIESLISSAREYCEEYQNKTYITTQYKAIFDTVKFPLRITKPPIQSIDKIEFQQADGTLIEWDSTNYIADTTGNFAIIALSESGEIPEELAAQNKLQVTYTAGHESADDVSDRIKTAMKLLVAQWHEKRLPIENAMNYELPFTVKSLLDLDRVMPV